MRKFYYAFEWVERPMREIWLLIHKDEKLDYDLALMNYIICDSEIISRCFIIGVDSEQALQEFQNKVGLQLDVSNWRISSQGEFDRGVRFPEGLTGGYGEWLWGTMVSGRNNMPRIDKTASQSDGNHFDYFVCYWLITENGLDRFPQVHATSEKLGLLIYQFHPTLKEGCCYHKLGIRVPSPSDDLLHEFIKQVGNEIGLTDWQPIKNDEFYDGVKFAYNYNVENFVEYNRKYAARNNQSGCR
ncbi:MAG: hypothetical protein H0X30_06800 [Anaerolineae bacterium]|nr:hypothetical protein [Anaerolineae bacterium]